MTEYIYYLAFTPSCNKDTDSVSILSQSNDEKLLRETFLDLLPFRYHNLPKYQLQECKDCSLKKEEEEIECLEKTCSNCSKYQLQRLECILYSFPMKQAEYQEMGLTRLGCIDDCRINLPLFWMIKAPRCVTRQSIINELEYTVI